MTETRILLDTNVWNYLSDHADAATLATAARKGRVTIILAPAVVYESLAINDTRKLRARSQLLSDHRWKRLMPEAYSESQEVLSQVRELRREWLLAKPPKGEFQRLYRDWRRNGTGFWARLRTNPELVSGHIRQLQQEILEHARDETKAVRKSQVDNKYPVWKVPLNTYVTEVSKELGADEQISVAAWRRDALSFWTFHLRGLTDQPTPLENRGGYVDWLSGELDFGKAKKSAMSWYRFWLIDVTDNAMPRAWLRWASGLLQQFSGWSRGTPGDNQLSTYMMDADWFITADVGLHRIVQKLHTDAPFPVALPLLIGADEVGATAALNAITNGGAPVAVEPTDHTDSDLA